MHCGKVDTNTHGSGFPGWSGVVLKVTLGAPARVLWGRTGVLSALVACRLWPSVLPCRHGWNYTSSPAAQAPSYVYQVLCW